MTKVKTKIKFSEKRANVILVQDRVSKTSKRSLRPALRARRITPWSDNIRPIPDGAYIINFGGGALPFPSRDNFRILNPPDKVGISANKLKTFQCLKEAQIPHVLWTTSRDEAAKWFSKDHKVLSRHSLSSSGGRGISVAGDLSQLREAPLYTRYFPKTHEFRVHVVSGKAIDLTEKKLRNELREKEHDRVVRSHDNGWIHAHGNLSITHGDDLESVRSLGVKAIKAVGLDFGAVDILAILDEQSPRRLKSAVVCEINSAPGIENLETQQAYVNAFNAIIGV